MPDRVGFTPTQETVSYLTERFQLGFGVGRLSPVARGAMGQIWRLSLPGHDYAVKELFWGADEAAACREAAFRDAAAAAGVTSPLNLRADDGRIICHLPADFGGAAVRMFSWVEGNPVNQDGPDLPQWVGRTLGVLHALRHPCDGIATDPWYDHVPKPARWDELVAEAETTKQPWAAALSERVPLLRSLTPHVKPVDPAVLVYNHMDFQPQNVLTDAAGAHVLLDWEDAGPGMPDRVLASLLCNWGTHDGTINVGRVRRILEAYRRAGGHAALTGLDSFSTVLAGYINYIEAQVSVSLDAAQPADTRDYATRELVSSLADPPRLDLYRALLGIAQGC